MGTEIQRLDAFELLSVYSPHFNPQRIPPGEKEEWKRHAIVETFPTGGAIALHYLTLGIFTTIFFGLKHTKFPRIRPDDFSAGKAIGFLFIPFYNIYWIFVFWLRLADRINFQFRLRDQPDPVSRSLVLATLIVLVIPYAGIVSWLILFPIVVSQMQSACNALAIEHHTARGAAVP